MDHYVINHYRGPNGHHEVNVYKNGELWMFKQKFPGQNWLRVSYANGQVPSPPKFF